MPFGSGTILSFTASYALHEGIDNIIWGATADDGAAHSEYTSGFCNALSDLIKMATGGRVTIHTPFAEKHKPEIVSEFANKHELFANTWSCRCASKQQCGTCEGCTARRVSASLAGITDKTIYTSAAFANPASEFVNRNVADFTDAEWKHIQDVVILSCANPG